MQSKTLYRILFLALLAARISASAQVPTTGLLTYFSLDGNVTNTGPANVTVNPVNTSFTTNASNTPNTAVQFGGAPTSYLDFTDNSNLDFSGTTNFTISFSFYFNGNSTSGLVDNCLNYGGWGVWLWSTVSGTWNLQFNYKNSSVGSPAATAFTKNAWHHVAAIRNNGTLSLYIDGALRLSAPEGSLAPSYPINMIAGAMAFSGLTPPRYNPFGGKLDELRIYNRALSALEVAQLAPITLPLKLGDFSAFKIQGGIQLNWETISEQNTAYFEIEKSPDGIHWSSIGSVNASGNSVLKQNYRFTDLAPVNGTSFYRLKMADRDGVFTFSRVITVKAASEWTEIRLFPNPAHDLIQLRFPATDEETIRMFISDAAGKTVYSISTRVQPGINSILIPLLPLAKGIYRLTLQSSTNHITRSFIKD